MRLIDFEEDPWRQDNQYLIEDENMGPKLLFNFKKIGEGEDDNELKIDEKEEVLQHYIIALSHNKFLIYPLKEAIHLKRGLIVTCSDGNITSVTKTSPPPIDLIRPGVSPQKQNGVIKDILFLGGNEGKMCHVYNIENDKWTENGKLPDYHLVTEQINFVYNEFQTMTVYSQINFKTNKFEFIVCTNKKGIESNTEWEAIHKQEIAIENFHIKNAIVIDDRVVFFARGRPRNVKEQCCSFLLSFKLKTEGGIVIGFDGDYHYLKVDETMYCQLHTKPQLSKKGDDLIYRAINEKNFTDNAINQVCEIVIPMGNFDEDKVLDEAPASKMIDVLFGDEKKEEEKK